MPGRVEGPAVAFAFRATAVERGPVFLLPVPYSLVLVFLYPGTSSLAPQPAYSQFKTSSTRRSRAQSPPTTINGCPILRLFLAKGGTPRSPRRERAASAPRKPAHPLYEKSSTRRSRDQIPTHHNQRLPHPSLISGEGWDTTIASEGACGFSLTKNHPPILRETKYAAKPRSNLSSRSAVSAQPTPYPTGFPLRIQPDRAHWRSRVDQKNLKGTNGRLSGPMPSNLPKASLVSAQAMM